MKRCKFLKIVTKKYIFLTINFIKTHNNKSLHQVLLNKIQKSFFFELFIIELKKKFFYKNKKLIKLLNYDIKMSKFYAEILLQIYVFML